MPGSNTQLTYIEYEEHPVRSDAMRGESTDSQQENHSSHESAYEKKNVPREAEDAVEHFSQKEDQREEVGPVLKRLVKVLREIQICKRKHT